MNTRRLGWGVGSTLFGGFAIAIGLVNGVSLSTDFVGRGSGAGLYILSGLVFLYGIAILTGIISVKENPDRNSQRQ